MLEYVALKSRKYINGILMNGLATEIMTGKVMPNTSAAGEAGETEEEQDAQEDEEEEDPEEDEEQNEAAGCRPGTGSTAISAELEAAREALSLLHCFGAWEGGG